MKDADAIVEFVMRNAVIFSRQGSVQKSWRRYGTRTLGPFFRLVFRVEGKTRTVYLGVDRVLAHRVHATLAELQRPLKERRAMQVHKKLLRQAFKSQKAELGQRLQAMGLHFHGNEIRGWRDAFLTQ